MSVAIIGVEELRANVRFEDLIEPMEEAFAQTSRGAAESGLVLMFPQADRQAGDVVVKTGVVVGHSVHVVKVAPWFAINAASGQPQGGFIAVFDSATGRTLAILEERHYLSNIRTAAAGAVAARWFAPQAVRTAAVIGTGVQAFWQSLALNHERRFERLLIHGRSAAKAEALAERLKRHVPEATIEIAPSAEVAVRQADAVITATMSREPFVRTEWLHPGQHITAVGADDPTKCELDAGVLRAARVFVDQRGTACANGDVHRAIAAGVYSADLLAGEIGEVVLGRLDGRADTSDITVAKLVGLGAQDLLAAEVALHACRGTPTGPREGPASAFRLASQPTTSPSADC